MSEIPGLPSNEVLSPLDILIERVRISDKLTLTVVPFEHLEYDEHLKATRLNEDDLKRLVKSTDGAILEYVPHEIERLKDNPFIKSPLVSWYYDQIMESFTPLQEAYFNAGKDVYSIDPAHDENLMPFRTVPHAAIGLAVGAPIGAMVGPKVGGWISKLTGGMKNLIRKKSYKDKQEQNKVQDPSRRRFLKIAAGAVLGGITTGSLYESSQHESTFADQRSGEPNDYRLEANFRRAVYSEGLKQLGQKIDEESNTEQNLLFAIPKGHWKSIKQRLADPIGNRGEFDKWRTIFGGVQTATGIDFNQSFFTIRKFHQTNSGSIAQEHIKMQ